MPPTARSQTTSDAVAVWTQGALESLGWLAGLRLVGLEPTEGGGRRLRFTASDRANSERPAWCHIDAYDNVPSTPAVRAGHPVVGRLARLSMWRLTGALQADLFYAVEQERREAHLVTIGPVVQTNKAHRAEGRDRSGTSARSNRDTGRRSLWS